MAQIADIEQQKDGLQTDIANLRVVFRLIPWRMRWRIILLVLASVIAAGLDMVAVATMLPLTQMLTGGGEIPPVVRSYVIPVIGTSDRKMILLALALFVGLSFVIKNIGMIVIRWFSLGMTARASTSVQAGLLRRYISAPYASHRRRSKATILQAVTSAVPTALNAVLLGYVTVVVSGMTTVLLFLTILILSPLASLAAVVIFGGAALLIARVLKPWAIRAALRNLDIEVDAWRSVNPAIEGFRESRVFGKEDLFADSYAQNRTDSARQSRIQGILGELPKYLLEIVMIFGILVVALLLFATRSESVAFGLLAVFAAASIRIVPSLNMLVATFNGIRAGRPQLKLVAAEALRLEAEEAESRGFEEVVVELPRADIVVRDMGFRYPDGDQDVLSDVSVTIPAGSTVALVGASGAGKTTFADILAGLLESTTGSITVDGRDIAEFPRSWRSGIGMVSQKVYVWEATLRDLITFGDPVEQVDEAHLRDVVRRARLEELVESLPQGLDTVIGDSGARLSGGQTQRVGIARALYADPQVLILDEATSALDNETEHEITATIEALHGEITVIVIAHRLSTVKNADEILYFSRGRLRSRGTMQELRTTDPEFARLVELGSLT